jgi:transcriptional regulator with XRE-family HTH domain
MDLVRIGHRLSRLRENRGVSASELAKQMGISRGYLSRLENGRQLPSFPLLEAIGQSLGVELDYFFAKESSRAVAVHRAAGSLKGEIREDSTFTYEPLCEDRDHKLANPFIVIFTPHSRTKVSMRDVEYFHFVADVEWFRYVLEGSIVMHFEGGRRYALDVGDAIYYDLSVAQEIECTSDVPARVLTIFANPHLENRLRFAPSLLEEQM